MAFVVRSSSVAMASVDLSSHQHYLTKTSDDDVPKAKYQYRRRRNTFRKLSAFIPRFLGQQQVLEEIEETPSVKPKRETLQDLCKLTKFSKKELQLMYRGFKQGCPSGQVTLEQFKEIYSQFFPQGDSSQYAIFVFNTFDSDKNGQISFDEFVIGLSILSRGSEEEKLKWVFDLYDIDHDGFLTRDDVETVIGSIYDMMGPNTDPPMSKDTVKQHVDDVFSKMDENSDGHISWPEFLEACLHDLELSQSLHLFDTIFSQAQIKL